MTVNHLEIYRSDPWSEMPPCGKRRTRGRLRKGCRLLEFLPPSNPMRSSRLTGTTLSIHSENGAWPEPWSPVAVSKQVDHVSDRPLPPKILNLCCNRKGKLSVRRVDTAAAPAPRSPEREKARSCWQAARSLSRKLWDAQQTIGSGRPRASRSEKECWP